MNLYFRLFYLLLSRYFKNFTKNPATIFDEFVTRFRVLPTDCDINRHLTNARYLSFGDLTRIDMMLKTRILKIYLNKRWMPVINAQSVIYAKPVKPLSKIEYRSTLAGWDDKYLYFEHRCYANDRLCAVLIARGMFICKGQKITPNELLHAINIDVPSPQLKPVFKQWKELLAEKRSLASGF